MDSVKEIFLTEVFLRHKGLLKFKRSHSWTSLKQVIDITKGEIGLSYFVKAPLTS